MLLLQVFFLIRFESGIMQFMQGFLEHIQPDASLLILSPEPGEFQVDLKEVGAGLCCFVQRCLIRFPAQTVQKSQVHIRIH